MDFIFLGLEKLPKNTACKLFFASKNMEQFDQANT